MSPNTEPTENDDARGSREGTAAGSASAQAGESGERSEAPRTESGKQPNVAEELERVLRETEASITELREELDRINEERLQHAQVDRLEEHMANSTVRWKVIKEFLRVMLGELRGGREEEQDVAAAVTQDQEESNND